MTKLSNFRFTTHLKNLECEKVGSQELWTLKSQDFWTLEPKVGQTFNMMQLSFDWSSYFCQFTNEILMQINWYFQTWCLSSRHIFHCYQPYLVKQTYLGKNLLIECHRRPCHKLEAFQDWKLVGENKTRILITSSYHIRIVGMLAPPWRHLLCTHHRLFGQKYMFLP